MMFFVLVASTGCDSGVDADKLATVEDVVDLANPAVKNEIHNKVTQIIDGDSFQLTHADGKTELVNLMWVDAPEREQPFGREARQFLKDKLLNRSVSFSEHNEVLIAGKSLNLLLLQSGYAWLIPAEESVAEKHFEVQIAYSDAQTAAMNNLQGLWGLAHELRVPPWVWRQQSTQRTMKPDQLRQMAKAKAMQQKEQEKALMQKNMEAMRAQAQKQMSQMQKQQQLNKNADNQKSNELKKDNQGTQSPG